MGNDRPIRSGKRAAGRSRVLAESQYLETCMEHQSADGVERRGAVAALEMVPLAH